MRTAVVLEVLARWKRLINVRESMGLDQEEEKKILHILVEEAKDPKQKDKKGSRNNPFATRLTARQSVNNPKHKNIKIDDEIFYYTGSKQIRKERALSLMRNPGRRGHQTPATPV